MRNLLQIVTKYTICTAALLGLSLSGCNGEVTGGGWIPSTAGDSEIANFGFNASSCESQDVNNPTGHFTYLDRAAPSSPGGVKMNGRVIAAGLCGEADSEDGCLFCEEGAYQVVVNYRSTNPRNRGPGSAIACFSDGGEGANADDDDTGSISVLSGPYAGYINEGNVQGNIQAHPCED